MTTAPWRTQDIADSMLGRTALPDGPPGQPLVNDAEVNAVNGLELGYADEMICVFLPGTQGPQPVLWPMRIHYTPFGWTADVHRFGMGRVDH